MVYASPDDLFSQQSPTFSALTAGDKVEVFFKGSGLHTIAGPVPFVDINKTYGRTEAGILQSINNKITINGKIVKTSGVTSTTPGSGTAAIIKAVDDLQNLFTCDGGLFEIKCGSTVLLSASGAKVNSFNANKSNDNWLFTSDYTVELEYYTTISGYSGVKRGSDSWSLEPIEEYLAMDTSLSVNTKGEYHNPQLKPTAPSAGSPQPGAGGGTPGSQGVALRIVNIPQFKLSRKLTAEGISNTTGCATGDYTAYLNARDWVTSKLREAFNGPYGQGGAHTGSSLYLYNHLRTINFSQIEGTYEVNDTWLAMPTGIKYVEDYTIESSSDDKLIKTVRVQGTIQGLSMASTGVHGGASGIMPTGSGVMSLQGFRSGVSGSFTQSNLEITGPSNNATSSNTFFDNKYQNANSGWIYDIKPYLYRRAHIGLNSPERTTDYISQNTTPQPPPNNPVYCKENFLNIIPVSTNETHDPRKGSISYNYQFNNQFRFLSGVLSESISMNDTGPTDVINEAFVLGRRLGPVLQSLGSKTSAKRDLTFEIIVLPPSSWKGIFLNQTECPLYTGGQTYSGINSIIEGMKPFGDRLATYFPPGRTGDTGQVYVAKDDHSWNPTEGRYVRQISWVYQTCNISRNWIDT
jgi:hypothetical protein